MRRSPRPTPPALPRVDAAAVAWSQTEAAALVDVALELERHIAEACGRHVRRVRELAGLSAADVVAAPVDPIAAHNAELRQAEHELDAWRLAARMLAPVVGPLSHKILLERVRRVAVPPARTGDAEGETLAGAKIPASVPAARARAHSFRSPRRVALGDASATRRPISFDHGGRRAARRGRP